MPITTHSYPGCFFAALLLCGMVSPALAVTDQAQPPTPEEQARYYQQFITERCTMMSEGLPLEIEIEISNAPRPEFEPGLIDRLISDWSDWTDEAYILVRMHGPTPDGQYISGYSLAPMSTARISSPDDRIVIECPGTASPCMPTDWVFSDPEVAQRYDGMITRNGRRRNFIALTCWQPNRVHFGFNTWIRTVSEGQ